MIVLNSDNEYIIVNRWSGERLNKNWIRKDLDDFVDIDYKNDSDDIFRYFIDDSQSGLSKARSDLLESDTGVRLLYEQTNYWIDNLLDIFSNWVESNDYAVLERDDYVTGEKDVVGVKARKRGNDKYKDETLGRFEDIRDNIPNKEFFDKNDINNLQNTSCILVTYTYDSDEKDFLDAWNNVGEDFNRSISNLRNKFGDVEFVRAWEAQTKRDLPYPHVHALVYFKEDSFTAKYINDNWRIFGKGIEGSAYEEINSCWDNGWVDIIAVYNIEKAFNYVKKYLTEYLDNDSYESELNLALTWLFGKRSYGVSNDLADINNDSNVLSVIQNIVKARENYFVGGLDDRYSYDFLGSCSLRNRNSDKPPPNFVEFKDFEVKELQDFVDFN